MFDTVAVPTALEHARATLQSAERRVGVEHRNQVVELAPASPALLTELLPGGDLPAGVAVTVRGSASLMCWLLGATQRDRWIALIGWPELSAVALVEAGVDLERVVAVPDAGSRMADVLAALLDGIEIVVAGPRAQLTRSERRRLLARARQRATTIFSPDYWEGAALVLDVEQTRWSGPDRGAQWLREAHLGVVRRSRLGGAGARFDITRHDTTEPTALATRAAARRRAG
ncbi:hypothetical protein GCM10010413_36590 [Promicromonospora sukumoe]|uniref:Cell division inhibitor SulA n=1 Tax=Promicromonospora sukumoe TaxID=88382 RepID=A0A7W3PD51_9MICO|nr:hypothetical protein [Promicromonospora sukumoe]MBA8807600.1 cell division inhibitor SulA [Promicromonospora sukumoe]